MYLKYYLIYFENKDRNDLKQLQQHLINLNFIVSDIQIYKHNNSFIFGVSFKYKTIFELLYLIIISSYICNIYNLDNTNMLVNKLFCKNKIDTNLVKLFNTLRNYKVKIENNNIVINNNILKIDIESSNKQIKEILEYLLFSKEHIQNFKYFITNLQNKTKNIKVKQYLKDFLDKKLKLKTNKKVENKKNIENVEKEKILEIFEDI